MSIIVRSDTNTDFYRVPPGTYIARCYSVIDLGTYPTEYQGQKKNRHTVRISWEIPDETVERDGAVRPASVSKTYTHSLHDKAALKQHLEAWRGRAFTEEERKGFDLSKLLGAPCTLTIAERQGQDGKMHSYVSSVGKLGKGMTCQAAFNKPFEYSVSQGKNEAYLSLPEWMKKELEFCLEWTQPAPDVKEPAETTPGEKPEEDDVPF